MITFYRDNLAPEGLCELLYQTVPEQYHVPVVFTNHRNHTDDLWSEWEQFDRGWRLPLGSCRDMGIIINLNQLWGSVAWHPTRAISTDVWYGLLRLCYHEFGHVATRRASKDVTGKQYEARGREYDWTEHVADLWATERLIHLAQHDGRLAQPTSLTGYLGARLAIRQKTVASSDGWGTKKANAIKDWRCYKCGGQLSLTDVLHLGGYWGANRQTRNQVKKLLADRVTEYIDAAGRHHSFYTWGDALALGEREGRTY